jgi:hypothetical protein
MKCVWSVSRATHVVVCNVDTSFIRSRTSILSFVCAQSLYFSTAQFVANCVAYAAVAKTPEFYHHTFIDSTLPDPWSFAPLRNKLNLYALSIKRHFSNFSDEVVLRLFKSLVRPQLEFAVQALRPHLKKDIAFIEGVQGRATNLVHHLRDFQYEDRLRALHLTTLDTRLLR